jgi:hypothetical protein
MSTLKIPVAERDLLEREEWYSSTCSVLFIHRDSLLVSRESLPLSRETVANVFGFSVPVTLAPHCHARYPPDLPVRTCLPSRYVPVAERALERERGVVAHVLCAVLIETGEPVLESA